MGLPHFTLSVSPNRGCGDGFVRLPAVEVRKSPGTNSANTWPAGLSRSVSPASSTIVALYLRSARALRCGKARRRNEASRLLSAARPFIELWRSWWMPGCSRRFEVGSRLFYEHDYGYPQHEHLYCEKCGKMIEFQNPALEAILRDVCQRNSFQITGHTFIIRGNCQECNGTSRQADARF